MTKYNGHKNWNHWNVSLWLNNDESLYSEMRRAIRCCRSRRAAAERMLEMLPPKTPDGAPYSLSSVQAAMVGL
jgi:hypothetical protein